MELFQTEGRRNFLYAKTWLDFISEYPPVDFLFVAFKLLLPFTDKATMKGSGKKLFYNRDVV